MRIKHPFFILLLAVLFARPAVAVVPDLAALFDRTDAELEAEYEAASGERRWAIGLILADNHTTESGPAAGLAQLDKLPSAADMQAAGQTALADFARSIRSAALLRQGQPDKALAIGSALAVRADDIEVVELRARVLDHLGFLAIRQGQNTSAYAFARRASQAASMSRSRYIQGRVWNNEGLIMHMSGLYAQSMQRFRMALEASASVSFRSIDEIVTFNLGLAQLEARDFQSALRSFTVGTEWAESWNDQHRLLIAHTHRAMALLALNRPAEAVEALKRSLASQGDSGDADGMANAYRLRAQGERDLGDLAAASASVEAGLAIAVSSGNALRELQLKLLRVELLEEAGRSDEGLREARTLVAITAGTSGPESIAAMRKLADLEALSGNYQQAFELARRADDFEQAAKGDSYAQRLAMLTVANDVRQAEQRRAAAEQKAGALERASRKNSQISLAIITALGLTVLLAFLSRERNIQQRLIREQQRISRDLETQVADRTRALRHEMDERLAVERERMELRDSLAAADKLGALGKLTGGVAHDFNNLLTVINGAAEILVEKPDLGARERRRLAEAIASAGETGAEICRGLLAYARRQPLKPEVFDVRAHIESQMSLLEQTLGESVSLHAEMESAKVRVDPAQLTTAVINLLSNARDAMDGQGEVVIVLRANASDEDERVVIEVSDTGCGMSPEQVARASEPFYSTKESSLATGLGLSAVHGFMQQSGGDLEIESTLGQGTRMRLLLPPTDGRVAPVEVAAAPSEEPLVEPCRSINTLLVDDNDAVASMLSSMLKLLGHRVIAARTPEDALDLIEENNVDLLISDVVMPGSMNGVQLAACAKGERPDLRVLLLSGYVDENVTLPYPFLPKPFSQEIFRKTLEQVMSDSAVSADVR